MVEVKEYLDRSGRSPFGEWFDSLEGIAAAKVRTATARMEQGNFSPKNVSGVGGGVFEYHINFGPGYRIYFGKDGEQVVILLGGGTKARQQNDIECAQAAWKDYKQRKQKEKGQQCH